MSKGCSEDMTVVRYDMVAYSHDCSCILKTHNAYRKVLLLFDKRIPRTWCVPVLTYRLFPQCSPCRLCICPERCQSIQILLVKVILHVFVISPLNNRLGVIKTSSKVILRERKLTLNVNRMKRNPRKVRWTKAFRKAAGKEMTVVCNRLCHPSHAAHNSPGLDHRL